MDWESVKARLERLDIADGMWSAGDNFRASGNILPDIRAAIGRVEELERDALSSEPPYYRKWEAFKRAEAAEAHLAEARAEVERLKAALLGDAAAFARIRERWPHIEVPTRGSVGLLGRRVLLDPGSPTCLRCSLEDEIVGPPDLGEDIG